MSAVAEIQPKPATASPIAVTARAAEEVKRIVDEQRTAGILAADENVYLRVSVKGGAVQVSRTSSILTLSITPRTMNCSRSTV